MFKKLYKILIILSIFALCGCGKNVFFNINSTSITNIIYDGINIASSDFEGIIDKINNKVYEDMYNINVNGKPLIINTGEYTYNFSILDNFIVYEYENKNYYARIDKLDEYLKETTAKYEKDDFFNIEIISNYDTNNSDYLIKLDDSNSYVIINIMLNIYDFEVKSNNYASNTQNKISKIENNKIICIETNDLDNINISFKSPYNYIINITYEGGFITNMKKPN
ncbi:MAG: hypothetical protein IJ565_01825 [Bacilli bacterium]|nr:hypothetical protein [Bacilli bacterium]